MIEKNLQSRIRPVLATKLALVVSILVLSSVFITSVFIYQRYLNDYIKHSNTQTKQILQQLSINIENYIHVLRKLCYSPYYSQEIMLSLEIQPSSRAEKLNKKREIERYLREMLTIPRDDISRVIIFSDEIYKSGYTGEPHQNFQQENWYKQVLQEGETITFHSNRKNVGYFSPTIISASMVIHSMMDYQKILGVIRVDANYHGVKKVCDQVDFGSDSCLCILDENANIIYEHDNRNNRSIGLAEVGAYFDEKNNDHSVMIKNQKYLINKQAVLNTKWTIISVLGTDTLTGNIRDAKKYIFILAIIFSTIGIVLTLLVVRNFLSPLQAIVSAMRSAQNGNLEIRIDEKGNDELSYLKHTFNHMLEQLRQMIVKENDSQRKIYETQSLEHKARYRALCNQIRPHFLFNTLNTISLLVKMNQKNEAITSINDLSILLRGIVNTDHNITLRNELRIAESYLRLQRRINEQLIFTFDCPEELQGFVVPALIVQPLIENAIIHGFENQNNPSITVQCSRKDSKLLVHISDNGQGINEKKLRAIQEGLNYSKQYCDSPEGVGLLNIHERIVLRYGESYGLKINSKETLGTTVIIQLPMEE